MGRGLTLELCLLAVGLGAGCAPSPEAVVDHVRSIETKSLSVAEQEAALKFVRTLSDNQKFRYDSWSRCVLKTRNMETLERHCRVSSFMNQTALERQPAMTLMSFPAGFDNSRRSQPGAPWAAQLPDDAQVVPGGPSKFMCRDGERVPYPMTAADFASDGWRALNIVVDEPSLYSDQPPSGEHGDDAWFSLSTVGDLNCGDVRSNLKRMGAVDSKVGIQGMIGLRLAKAQAKAKPKE